jgi:hypothetical protein
MTHTTLKRSVAIQAIDNLKESIKDWRAYQSEHYLEENQSINNIIADCETVIAALEGDTITIED